MHASKVLEKAYLIHLIQSFQIANPVLGETAAQNAAVAAGAGNAIGDCIEDTFSVSTAGGSGSPVICSTNTGYHSKFLIMTTKGLCIVICFMKSSDFGQYGCGLPDSKLPDWIFGWSDADVGNQSTAIRVWQRRRVRTSRLLTILYRCQGKY